MKENYLFGLASGVKAMELEIVGRTYVRYLDCTDYGVYVEKIASPIIANLALVRILIDILNEADPAKVDEYIRHSNGRLAAFNELPAGLIVLSDLEDYIHVSPMHLRVFKSGEEVFNALLKDSPTRANSLINPKVAKASMVYVYALNACIKNEIDTSCIEMIKRVTHSQKTVETQAALLNYFIKALGSKDEDFLVGALFEEKKSPYYYGRTIGWLDDPDGRPVFAVTQDLWNINVHLINSDRAITCAGIVNRKFNKNDPHDLSLIKIITYPMVHFLGYSFLPDNLTFRASTEWEWKRVNDTVWTSEVCRLNGNIEEKFGVAVA